MSDGWTRSLLEELRAGGFAPAAWLRFLRRSFEHARDARAERSRAHRQTLLLGGLGLAGWGGVAAAGRPWLALAGAGWWALLVLMVDWHLGMLDGLPALGPANGVSLLRAAAVPVLPALAPGPLAVLLVALGTLDVLDGPLARGRGEVSRLGFWLDGSVDGIVVGTAAVSAARLGLLPAWALALVLARHGLQWIVVAAAYFVRARPPALDAAVPARLPGLVLFAGLVLALLDVPGAGVLVAAGAVGALTAFALTLVRSRDFAAAG